MNSVGVVPVDLLNLSEKAKSEALVANAKQIVSQYERKRGSTFVLLIT